MKFLSPDSGFMRGLSDAVDAIWINILMLVTSIPIITIGAALTAGHDATRRTLSGEGTATRNYFAAFRSNFAKSTGYWLIFGTTGALCVYSWIVLQITPLLIPKFALTIVWLIGFEWVWALQARVVLWILPFQLAVPPLFLVFLLVGPSGRFLLRGPADYKWSQKRLVL